VWACGCSWTGSVGLRRADPGRAGRVRSARTTLLRLLIPIGALAVLALGAAPASARPRGTSGFALAAAGDTTPPADTTGRAPADTTRGAPADTTASDTTRAAADTTAAGDTTAAEAPPFPAAVEPPDAALGAEVRSWDRTQILASSAESLLGFLEWELPGLTGLRVSYFGGPHLALDGVLGPGFVRVLVDGRELDPLEGRTPDLTRIPLVQIERLRVIRGADRLRIEVTTLSHGRGPAYSSIQGGTGRPSLNLIRGAFANGWGSHVQFAGAGDFLDVTGGPTPASWTDGWARVGWMPGGGHVGIEVRGRSQSVERTPTGVSDKFSRTDVALHGRADLGPGVQLDAWAARTRRTPDAGAATSDTVPTVTDDQGTLSLTAAGDRAFGQAVLRARSGDARPRVEGEVSAGVGPAPWLRLSAGARTASWSAFTTRSAEVAVRVEPRPSAALGLVLTGSAATGTRGVPRPLAGTADSVSFDALAGSAQLRLGPYTLTGRGTVQKLGRQLPLGFAFDTALAAGPAATVGGFEGGVEGPLIPVPVLADRVRVRGVWRRESLLSGGPLRYVPGNRALGVVEFRDAFFDRSLHLRLAFGATYRGPMATGVPGQAVTDLLPGQSLAIGRAEIRIDRFRIWWVGHDFGEIDAGDIAGIPHPLAPNVVGITWEWSN